MGDLNSKLTATREAHRSEQKRAAGQVDTITKLNREIDSLKRQLKVRLGVNTVSIVNKLNERHNLISYCRTLIRFENVKQNASVTK